jgi:phosphomannomutase
VTRTAVGEANVVEGMRACGSPLGGEGNGGVIAPMVGWVRDSLIAMALVLELLANEDRPLSSIVDEIPRYSMLKMKFDLTSIGGRSAIDPAIEKLRNHFASARINDVDGIRIDLDEGWAHVRASNTEPILRVITEAATPSDAELLCQDILEAAGLR